MKAFRIDTPDGFLLAVLGYALGTYGAWICGQLMRIVSGAPQCGASSMRESRWGGT